MKYLTIILAILPIVLIGIFYYNRDTLKEPVKLLSNLFIYGIISALIVVMISLLSFKIFPNYTNMENASLLKIFLYTFFFVSLIEEFIKWLMIYKICYKHPEFDQLYDIIIYSVYIGLGFAFFENLIYLIPATNGVLLAVFRGITAIPAHTCFQTFMGYYLSLFKKEKKKKFMALSLIIPITLHGIYDFLLYSNNIIFAAIFLIFLVTLFIITILKVNKIIKLDKNDLEKKIVQN